MTLSIITINLNNRAGLQRTIDSVICQTWKDYEWIVIDGGSTDGSKELIEQYQEHFAYWCSEPDRGVYNAMNKGIAKAKGEYLLFLNSGDGLHGSNVLMEMNINDFDVDIVTGISVCMDTGLPMKVYHPDILHQLYFDSLNHQSSFIKRDLFANYQYNEENRIVSDWEFFIRAILIDGHSFKYSDMIVADFDSHGISNQPELQELQLSERRRVFEKYFSSYVREDISDYFSIRESSFYMNLQYIRENFRTLYFVIRKLNSAFWRLRKLCKR